MKKLILIFPLIASGYVAAQEKAATLVAKNKPLYNLTVRIPMTNFFFQGIGIDEWKNVNPDYTNLSMTDPAWTYSSSQGFAGRGRTGGTGFMAGINFSPVNNRGKTRLVYGVETGILSLQGFSNFQYKSSSEVVDTVSFSSGKPDQYIYRDSSTSVEYGYTASRVVVAPRIGVYFNQLKRLGFGVGFSGSVGMSVGSRISKTVTQTESLQTYALAGPNGNPEPQYGAGYLESGSSSVGESRSVKSSVNFSGGTFAEINYQLGKVGRKLEHYKIGLEIQAGMLHSSVAGEIKRTTPYYSTALTFAYAF